MRGIFQVLIWSLWGETPGSMKEARNSSGFWTASEECLEQCSFLINPTTLFALHLCSHLNDIFSLFLHGNLIYSIGGGGVNPLTFTTCTVEPYRNLVQQLSFIWNSVVILWNKNSSLRELISAVFSHFYNYQCKTSLIWKILECLSKDFFQCCKTFYNENWKNSRIFWLFRFDIKKLM